MKSCCTFISKERRSDPARYHEYAQDLTTESNMTLWKNDEGNAAAVLIAETDHTLITVSVSKNAAPGIYTRKISVILGSGETLTMVQKIRILDLELDSGEDYYLNLWQYPYASAAYYQVPPFSKEHLAIVKNEMRPYIEAGGKTGTAGCVPC